MVVVPYFLTLGLHLQRDLPRLIDKVKSAHPGLAIEVTPPLDQHPAMVEALLDRARESLLNLNMEARLIESREIAPGVRHFEFEALGVERLDFVPGQFTSFTDVIDGKEITRVLPGLGAIGNQPV